MTRLVPLGATARRRRAGIIARPTLPLAPPHRKPRRAARARDQADAVAAALPPPAAGGAAAGGTDDDDDDLYSVGPISGLSLDYVAPSAFSGRSRSSEGGDGA